LAVLAWLSGCASQPASDGAAIAHWTQLGARGEISLRAIVAASDGCPKAVVDGVTLPLLTRAGATPLATDRNVANGNPAFEAAFAVNSCELTLPGSARQASIGGQAVRSPAPTFDASWWSETRAAESRCRPAVRAIRSRIATIRSIGPGSVWPRPQRARVPIW